MISCITWLTRGLRVNCSTKERNLYYEARSHHIMSVSNAKWAATISGRINDSKPAWEHQYLFIFSSIFCLNIIILSLVSGCILVWWKIRLEFSNHNRILLCVFVCVCVCMYVCVCVCLCIYIYIYCLTQSDCADCPFWAFTILGSCSSTSYWLGDVGSKL